MTYVYGWLVENAGQEDREKIDKLVFDPPLGISKEEMAELPEWKNAGQDFMAQFGQRVQADPFADRMVQSQEDQPS